MTHRALILGITGQDGAYLARFLINRGYKVHGTSRDVQFARLEGLTALGIREAITLSSASPIDFRSVADTIKEFGPDEIYNLSGQSSVALSFAQPAETIDSIVKGTLTLLEAMKLVRSKARFYNAGSSECFGNTHGQPANENTAFRPKSPYGVAKAAAVTLVANYREAYGFFACSGLLFNHESPLRPDRFVSRKITRGAARIAQGSRERLVLGDLSIQRDWGWAPDYVDAMWRMLQHENPQDFVVASGQAHSLEEFVAAAFAEVNLDWRDYVDHDASLARPADITISLGDATRAARLLGWKPTVAFREIVARMVRGEREGAGVVS